MKTRFLSTLLAVATIATTHGRASIVYVSQPSFPAGPFLARPLDLNADGRTDFNLPHFGMICTMDVPTSGCYGPFYIGCEGTNQMQTVGNYVQMNSFGAWIGSQLPSETDWTTPGYSGAGLAFYWWSRYGQIVNGDVVHYGWYGPLAATGVGYLGVRFTAADGLHYGWIRVRMPKPSSVFGSLSESAPVISLPEFGPMIVDYAYEGCTNTPIRAGDIGSDSDSTQFVVDFRNPGGTPHGSAESRSAGMAILTGNKLRCELGVGGLFTSVELGGPAAPYSNAKPIFQLGQPLAVHLPPCAPGPCSPDFTAYFGETTLNPGQIVHLQRGALYFNLDHGAVVGRLEVQEWYP